MFKLVERTSFVLLPYRKLLSFLGGVFATAAVWVLFSNDAVIDHYLPLLTLMSAWCFVLFAITSGAQARQNMPQAPRKGLFKRFKYALFHLFWQLISLVLVLLTVFTIITSIRVAKFALAN